MYLDLPKIKNNLYTIKGFTPKSTPQILPFPNYLGLSFILEIIGEGKKLNFYKDFGLILRRNTMIDSSQLI